MSGYKVIITVKVLRDDEKFNREIIMDGFESYEEAKSWQEWLHAVYKKVKDIPYVP